jgi:hypothetical protein
MHLFFNELWSYVSFIIAYVLRTFDATYRRSFMLFIFLDPRDTLGCIVQLEIAIQKKSALRLYVGIQDRKPCSEIRRSLSLFIYPVHRSLILFHHDLKLLSLWDIPQDLCVAVTIIDCVDTLLQTYSPYEACEYINVRRSCAQCIMVLVELSLR